MQIFGQNPWIEADSKFQDPCISGPPGEWRSSSERMMIASSSTAAATAAH